MPHPVSAPGSRRGRVGTRSTLPIRTPASASTTAGLTGNLNSHGLRYPVMIMIHLPRWTTPQWVLQYWRGTGRQWHHGRRAASKGARHHLGRLISHIVPAGLHPDALVGKLDCACVFPDTHLRVDVDLVWTRIRSFRTQLRGKRIISVSDTQKFVNIFEHSFLYDAGFHRQSYRPGDGSGVSDDTTAVSRVVSSPALCQAPSTRSRLVRTHLAGPFSNATGHRQRRPRSPAVRRMVRNRGCLRRLRCPGLPVLHRLQGPAQP